jgi:hypothetical protein
MPPQDSAPTQERGAHQSVLQLAQLRPEAFVALDADALLDKMLPHIRAELLLSLPREEENGRGSGDDSVREEDGVVRDVEAAQIE